MEPFGSIHFPPGSPRRRPSLPLCNLGVFASLSAFLFLYVNASTLSPVDDLHIVNKEVAPDGFSRPSVFLVFLLLLFLYMNLGVSSSMQNCPPR